MITAHQSYTHALFPCHKEMHFLFGNAVWDKRRIMPKLHGWQTISLSKEIIQEITEKVTTCWQITIFSQSFLNLKEYSELIQKEGYSKGIFKTIHFTLAISPKPCYPNHSHGIQIQ